MRRASTDYSEKGLSPKDREAALFFLFNQWNAPMGLAVGEAAMMLCWWSSPKCGARLASEAGLEFRQSRGGMMKPGLQSLAWKPGAPSARAKRKASSGLSDRASLLTPAGQQGHVEECPASVLSAAACMCPVLLATALMRDEGDHESGRGSEADAELEGDGDPWCVPECERPERGYWDFSDPEDLRGGGCF